MDSDKIISEIKCLFVQLKKCFRELYDHYNTVKGPDFDINTWKKKKIKIINSIIS